MLIKTSYTASALHSDKFKQAWWLLRGSIGRQNSRETSCELTASRYPRFYSWKSFFPFKKHKSLLLNLCVNLFALSFSLCCLLYICTDLKCFIKKLSFTYCIPQSRNLEKVKVNTNKSYNKITSFNKLFYVKLKYFTFESWCKS